MKKFKKITSAVAALALAACAVAPMTMVSLPVSATGSIEINNSIAGHKYEAYQIFKGTLGDGGVLGQIEWGDNVDTTIKKDNPETGKTLVQAIQDLGGDFASLTEAKDIAEALGKITEADHETTKKFADIVSKYLTGSPKTSGEQAGDKYKINDLDDGYYLVKDEDSSLSGNDAYTRFILRVAGDVTNVTPKSSLPTVEKKIKENVKEADTAYTGETDKHINDVGDFCIGEDITFKLYGTMPDTIGDYDRYYYEFSDTFETGKFELLDTAADTDNVFSEGDLVVTIDSVAIPNKVTIDGKDYTNWILIKGENGFNVVFNDIKKVYTAEEALKGSTGGATYVQISTTTKVTVEYHAKLTASAEIGNDGQWNAVDLTYSNNPNVKGNGNNTPGDDEKHEPEDKGKTDKDYVIAFTYEAVVDKWYDSKESNSKPEDDEVKFRLYREKTPSGAKEWAIVSNGKVTGWTDTETQGTEVGTRDGQIKITGLDDGTYFLRETATKAGYNKIDDVKFEIKATTANNQSYANGENTNTDQSPLTKLELGLNSESGEWGYTEQDATEKNYGKVNFDVVNKKGTSLPSTGGIGTTIFYLGGGAIVAVAGALLITKKRMGKAEEE